MAKMSKVKGEKSRKVTESKPAAEIKKFFDAHAVSSVREVYRAEEVDAFLDEVTEAYEALFKENLRLRDDVDRLRRDYLKSVRENLQTTRVARKTGESIRKNAPKSGKITVPKFKSTAEEAKFWETHSPLDYPDYFKETKIEVAKPLKHKRIVSIRLDDETIEALTKLARRRRIGVSTLARILITEELERSEKAS